MFWGMKTPVPGAFFEGVIVGLLIFEQVHSGSQASARLGRSLQRMLPGSELIVFSAGWQCKLRMLVGALNPKPLLPKPYRSLYNPYITLYEPFCWDVEASNPNPMNLNWVIAGNAFQLSACQDPARNMHRS